MGAVHQAMLGEYAAASGPTDPSFSSVKLLLHFDGTNGQTTTTDSSSAAHAMTGVTGLVLSTAQTKFGATSSDFSGAGGGAAWTTPDHADWDFGNGQFTIEGWIRFKSSQTGSNIALAAQWGGSNSAWYFGTIGSNLAFYYSTTGSDSPNVSAAWTPSINTWYHIAVDRDASNVIRTYVDGVVKGSATVSSTFFNSTSQLQVGCNTVSARLDGFLDDVRITKGVARYAGAFTPPTAAFPDA